MKNFVLIIGTRPEIIKVAPFIKAAGQAKLTFQVLHTGQHYSPFMDRVFWRNFGLRPPKLNLKIRAETQAEQVGRMMIEIEKMFLEKKPDYVMVYADLNTALAGALAAVKLNIPIIHLEGGLRSHDLTMPEEVNRVLISHVAAYHFVPHRLHQANLEQENVRNGIYVVGNTIVDSIHDMVKLAHKRSTILKKLHLTSKNYFVMTAHRPAGVDNKSHLGNTLLGAARVAERYRLPLIFPVHPRTKNKMEKFGIIPPAAITAIQPLDYFDFLQLAVNSRLMLSDSGGIQEEACILGIPLVTLRENTERPETIDLGSNILAGFDPDKIVSAVDEMLKRKPTWKHPYGSRVSEEIVRLLKSDIL